MHTLDQNRGISFFFLIISKQVPDFSAGSFDLDKNVLPNSRNSPRQTCDHLRYAMHSVYCVFALFYISYYIVTYQSGKKIWKQYTKIDFALKIVIS